MTIGEAFAVLAFTVCWLGFCSWLFLKPKPEWLTDPFRAWHGV